MRAFVAVLRRELAERWLIPVAALLLGLAPLAAPLLPIAGFRGPELRSGTALALALIASCLLAVVLGSSILARDLSERRLGFYFSRPLPAWTIWAGKMAAAFVLALGSGLLIVLPCLLLGDRLDPSGLFWKVGLADNVGLWAAGVSLLILLSNAAAVMFRSRSPWLLLDLGAAALLSALLWVEMDRLSVAGAYGAVMQIQVGLLAVLALALAAASAVQVLRARTDLRLGHRLLSLTLWGLLGLATIAVALYGRWILAAGPEDVIAFRFVQPAPAGTWVALAGPVGRCPGFEPLFLLDTRSGRSFRIPSSVWDYGLWNGPVFSRDGRRAVWLEPEGRRRSPLYARWLDLDRPGARPSPAPIQFDESAPRGLALSGDGRRLAAIQRERILVMDLVTGRNLAAVPVPPGRALWEDRLRFLDSGALRFYGIRAAGEGEGEGDLRVIDVDPGTGKVLRSLSTPAPGEWATMLSPDGNRLLLATRDLSFTTSHVRVVDLRTGASSPSIPVQRVTGGADFLGDDRVLVSEHAGGRMILRLLDLQGVERRRFEIPADRLRIGGRPAPGLLAISILPPGSRNDWLSRRSLLLDLDRGTWRPLADGMVPVAWSHLTPGSLGTRLFFQNEGGLFEVDPATGHRRVILQPEEKR
ncbi:MAG: hypothetical protein ABUT39_23980 [Acidobacteriota bacterium]